MKVLVIPDVHLKPWIFDRAMSIMSDGKCDMAVFMGDLVDDWGCEGDVDLYEETLGKAVEFVKKYPSTLWCHGNHDLAYLWEDTDHPGYSEDAADTVIEYLSILEDAFDSPENMAVIHRIDNVLFSHAGLTAKFVASFVEDAGDDIDDVIAAVNSFGEDELSAYFSPVWARPQDDHGYEKLYAPGYLQVVGHTPVKGITQQDELLSTDTFSTWSTGAKYGDEQFCIVDTVTKEWDYAE